MNTQREFLWLKKNCKTIFFGYDLDTKWVVKSGQYGANTWFILFIGSHFPLIPHIMLGYRLGELVNKVSYLFS